MEFIFEVIFQFLGEILLQVVVELVTELGLEYLADRPDRPKNPVLSTIWFIICGAMAGGISLWIFPASLITNHHLRMVNLIVSPVIIGGIVMLVGRIRERKDHVFLRMDKFSYAFAFAFAMALVRFSGAA